MFAKIDKNYIKIYEKVFLDIQTAYADRCFDEAAIPSYTHSNWLMRWLFWSRIKSAMSLIGDIRGVSVLDFGCGGGVTFSYLQTRGCCITGCENQFPELPDEVCRRLGLKVSICKDVFLLEGTYDRILALDVLEHVDDIERIVVQLKNLLAPKGRLIVSGPTENRLYKLGRWAAGFSGEYHVRNIYDIEKQCRDNGLQNQTTKILYWPAPLFRISCWRK